MTDSQQDAREHLRILIQADKNREVVGEASNGYEALEMVRSLEPDLVIMGITMPDLNWLETTRKIADRHDRTKIVVLSMHNDPNYVLGMLKAGAFAYLNKPCVISELNKAIDRIMTDRKYISPSMTTLVFGTFHQDYSDMEYTNTQKLTSREKRILQLIAEAKRSKEIAEELRIDLKTVFTHRRNIMKKLKAGNLASLTHFAIKAGLTDLYG